MYYYLISFGVVLLCALIAGGASAKVRSTYQAQREIANSSGMTGNDVAQKLLRANGIKDIRVGVVDGELTDHYHPTKKVVNLSRDVYANASVASVAISAHEIGHVLQKKKGYFPYKLRTFLVPITNIGSRLAVPLVLLGLILDLAVGTMQTATLGYYLAWTGVALYGLATLFALATLPVEIDASRRAKKMLEEQGILTKQEMPYAEAMLSAAGRTYFASLATSLIYFLRFALWVFMLFGNRRRD